MFGQKTQMKLGLVHLKTAQKNVRELKGIQKM